jgi:cytochrome c oxidase cbb3-type subunit III
MFCEINSVRFSMGNRGAKFGVFLRHGRRAKGVLACLLAVSALAICQDSPDSDQKKNPLGSGKKVVAQGAELYNRSCTGCHGVNGAAGERGPALAGEQDYVRDTDPEIFAAVKDGITGTGMPPSGLPPNDIWKIVAYIRSLRATASDAFVPGDVAYGERIFWDQGRCGSCHMLNGQGGILGPDLSNIAAERTLQQLRLALTQPKVAIPTGYQPADLVTSTGRRLSGIIKNEDNFSVQFLDNNQQLQLFSRNELREIHYKDSSLMPAHYDKTLSSTEVQDLLAFLSRLERARAEQHKEDVQ